jgi:SAM-dependent methyltransferase
LESASSRHCAESIVDRFLDEPLERALAHLNDATKPGGLAVDLGCGRGLALNKIARLGMRVIGIDVYAGALGSARVNAPGSWLMQGNIEHIPLADSSVNAVFSRSVLQYTDWHGVVKECSRILKPGGRVAFVENLAGNPVARTYRVLHRTLGWRYTPFQTPRAHINWSERFYFTEVLDGVTLEAYHLTTPLALVVPKLREKFLGTPMPSEAGRMYRLLGHLDRALLARFTSLARLAWFILILGAKHA